MNVGEVIKKARKEKQLRGIDLGDMVGVSQGTIWNLETSNHQGNPDPELIIKIAAALECEKILYVYLQNNPIYSCLWTSVSADLGDVIVSPAIILGRFAQEAGKARKSAVVLQKLYSNSESERTADDNDAIKMHLKQIFDVARCGDELELLLIDAKFLTREEMSDIYSDQQQKCVDHGHHDSDKDVA